MFIQTMKKAIENEVITYYKINSNKILTILNFTMVKLIEKS